MHEQDPVDVDRLTARIRHLVDTEPDVLDMPDDAVQRCALLLRPLLQPHANRAAV